MIDASANPQGRCQSVGLVSPPDIDVTFQMGRSSVKDTSCTLPGHPVGTRQPTHHYPPALLCLWVSSVASPEGP